VLGKCHTTVGARHVFDSDKILTFCASYSIYSTISWGKSFSEEADEDDDDKNQFCSNAAVDVAVSLTSLNYQSTARDTLN